MEWYAVKTLMAEEEVDIDFDIPTDLELAELAAACVMSGDDEDEEDEILPF